MNVLITGANGFVGNYVASYLEKSAADVYRHTRQVFDLAKDAISVAGIDVIVHCAAAAGPWHNVETIVSDNIVAMQRLIKHAKAANIKLFIFISSISVYKADFYGMSKAFCEQLLTEAEIPAISLRCPGIVGPHCNGRHWLARLANQMRTQDTVEIYDPFAAFNSTAHVDDIARFVTKRLDEPAIEGHKIVNFCADNPITIREAAILLADGLGKEVKFDEYKSDLLYGASFDVSQLRNEWNFQPMSVRETIKRYAQELRHET